MASRFKVTNMFGDNIDNVRAGAQKIADLTLAGQGYSFKPRHENQQDQWARLQRDYPKGFDALVAENTDQNLRLQERLAFEMDDWTQDPISRKGAEDAAFRSNVSLGTGRHLFDDDTAGYYDEQDNTVHYSGHAMNGNFDASPHAVIQHEQNHGIFPGNDSNTYNNSVSKDEEYRVRQLGELYNRFHDQYPPASMRPEVTQEALDYFDQVSRNHAGYTGTKPHPFYSIK